MSTFSKINSLLSKKDKLRAFKLFVLMMFGMLLEIAGVGLIIPILALINNNEMASNNIYFSKFLSF